jgi:hypothetical protein
MRELAEGIHYTVVNGEVLLEKARTPAIPGRVLKNARHRPRPRLPSTGERASEASRWGEG